MTPAILFLHGFPNNGRLWEKQVRELGQLAEVVTFEWGSQPLPTVDNTIAQVIERVNRILAVAPRRPVFLVGHDLGCFLAAETARVYPQHFAGQILINGAGLKQFSMRWYRLSQWLRSSYVTLLWTLPRLDAIAASRFGHRVRQFFYTLGGVGRQSRVRSPRYNDVHAIGIYRELGLRALRGMFRRSAPSAVPTLLVSGGRDPFLIRPTAHEVKRSFTCATRVTVDGGHWLPLTHPRAINDLISKFLMEYSYES